jgi:putative ABC transport system permease protein
MFATILARSLMMRKFRFVLPAIALLIGVSVSSALVMVTTDIEDKVARELRAFGPNMIVLPRSDKIDLTVGGINLGSISEAEYISESDARLIRALPLDVFGDEVKGILGKNAYLYSVVDISGGGKALLAGTWFDEMESVNLWWEIEGAYPKTNDSAILGMTIAEKLGKDVGDTIELSYIENIPTANGSVQFRMSEVFRIAGIVSTGGDDDSRIFADLDSVQNLTNKEGKINIMHISALCNECPLEDIAAVIERELPDVEVKTVEQVAKAEMDTLEMVKNLVGLIAIVSVGASILAVTTTFTLGVIERRKEIGLMKAVGASNWDVMALFLSEGMMIALITGILGFFAGTALSKIIGDYVFNSTISTQYVLILLSLGISIGIVIVSLIIPLRMALRVDPAIVLRGE